MIELKINLLKSGLELLDDSKRILIEKIKSIVAEMIHYSDYISEKLGYDYTQY